MKNLSLLMGLLVVVVSCNVTDDDNGGNTPTKNPLAGTYNVGAVVINGVTDGEGNFVATAETGKTTIPADLTPLAITPRGGATMVLKNSTEEVFVQADNNNDNVYTFVSSPSANTALYEVGYVRDNQVVVLKSWVKFTLDKDTGILSVSITYDSLAGAKADNTTKDTIGQLQGPATRADFEGLWDVVLSSTKGDGTYITIEMAPALTAPTEALAVTDTGDIILEQTKDTVNNIYVYDAKASKFFKDNKRAVFAVTYNRIAGGDVIEQSKGYMQFQITSKNEVHTSVPLDTIEKAQNSTAVSTKLATIS